MASQRGGFLPSRRDDLDALLHAYVLDKALYELGYELNNRPDWVQIPLAGLLRLRSPLHA
jgi:maltose alpha-D-glucosyltransferase/alpha-amylase